VDAKNQTFLWNLLMKLPNFSTSSESIFKHCIKTIYEQNAHRGFMSPIELQMLNKEFLALYIHSLNVNRNRENSPPPVPPKLTRQKHYNEDITQRIPFQLSATDNFANYQVGGIGIGSAPIKREVTSQMMQEYELLQSEYKNRDTKTDMVLQTERIEDKPIDNMEELMAQYIRNREEIDLIATTASNTSANAKETHVTLSISPLPLDSKQLPIEELTEDLGSATEKRVHWKKDSDARVEVEELKKEMQNIRESITKLYEIFNGFRDSTIKNM